MSWTTEQEDTAARLWNEGHSAGAIGKQIGKTRNAVNGKIDRMISKDDKRVKRGAPNRTPKQKECDLYSDQELLGALKAKDEGTLAAFCRARGRNHKSVRTIVAQINRETDLSEMQGGV